MNIQKTYKNVRRKVWDGVCSKLGNNVIDIAKVNVTDKVIKNISTSVWYKIGSRVERVIEDRLRSVIWRGTYVEQSG